MRQTIVMPHMGQSMDEGTVLAWRKKPGETVTRGEIVAEIETDKSVVELESFYDGVITELAVPAGTTVKTGVAIAYVDDGKSQSVSDKQQSEESQSTAEEPKAREPQNQHRAPAVPRATKNRLRVSPAARRKARQLGVELSAIVPSGPRGEIHLADVLKTGRDNGNTGAEAGSSRIPLSRMRRMIARRMTESKQTAPHFYVTVDADVTDVLARRELLKAAGKAVTVNDLVVRSVAIGLRSFPDLNSALRGEMIERFSDINIAVAVQTDEGLLTPVVKHADQLSVLELSVEIRRLAAAAAAGKLRASEIEGGTFTISNLGMFGVRSFAPIINPPQCATLGVGCVRTEARFLENGGLVPARIMSLSLSADHRITDGTQVARFLNSVRELLGSSSLLDG